MRTDAGTGARCPVCGMAVTDRDATATHLGVVYHCCCEQCTENFTAHPRLYVGKGALKPAGKAVLKHRVFVLARPASDADALKAALLGMMGVKGVEVSGAKVAVSYDLLEATAAQIEGAIAQAGAVLSQGMAQRLKRGWAQFTEDNELENLSAGDAPCCNRAPHA